MTRLISNDTARCVGRFGLGPDDPICPRREQCARYRQMEADREQFPDGYPMWVSVFPGMCRDGEDHMIEVDS